MKKRYEYIMWDGIYDNRKEEYISWYEIERVLNLAYNYNCLWERKYDELKKENTLLKKQLEGIKNGANNQEKK